MCERKYRAKKGKGGRGLEPEGIQGSEGEGEPFTRNGRMLNFRSFRRLFFEGGRGGYSIQHNVDISAEVDSARQGRVWEVPSPPPLHSAQVCFYAL